MLFFLAKYPHFYILFLLRYFHEQPSEREVSFAVLKHCPYKNSLIKTETEIHDWVHDLKCHTFWDIFCSVYQDSLESLKPAPSVRLSATKVLILPDIIFSLLLKRACQIVLSVRVPVLPWVDKSQNSPLPSSYSIAQLILKAFY